RTSGTKREVEALEDRSALFVEQRNRISDLIAQNESAMTTLDRTATALAGTKTGPQLSKLDAESAMAELEKLAARVSRYAAD
ncbi:MAG: hypothetical protein R3245_10875, partial [Kiloniellales bacterium]|nr:hypothetical protein [Kiloniellales bacterium]